MWTVSNILKVILLATMVAGQCSDVFGCDLNVHLWIGHYSDNGSYIQALQPRDIVNGGFNVEIADSVYLVGTITDCRGACKFRLTDSTRGIVITGEFENSLDTLKSQFLEIDPLVAKRSNES